MILRHLTNKINVDQNYWKCSYNRFQLLGLKLDDDEKSIFWLEKWMKGGQFYKVLNILIDK